MKDKFYNPYIIWSGIWLFICLAVLLISLQTNKLYWQAGLERERLLSCRGSYGTFAQRFGLFPEPWERRQFPSIYRDTLPWSPDRPSLPSLPEPQTGQEEGKDLYFWPPGPPSLLDAVWNQHNWLKAWQSQVHAGFFFTILSYLLFVVGFGAICFITALYQNHFRRSQEEQFETEIEARNLRIQVLEQGRNTLDLRLKLLDQVHEKALAAAREAQKTIGALEGKLQSEADRNEELQGKLQKARQEEKAALRLLHVLEDDRQKIAAEQTDILSRLVEAEKLPEAGLYGQKIRKARGRLRLNSFWLASLYKNLSFSPRALQNINEIQDAPEVFPSLPDALTMINGLTPEALKTGESLPPKSLVRFTTHDLEYFQGLFWEYRFSSDGRIFFGLSRSRTWNIDTILLKRRFPDKKEKYDRYLATTLGKDNRDLQPEPIS